MTDAAVAAVQTEPPRQDVPILPANKCPPSAFQEAEFAYARMSFVLPAGHTYEDILRPEYWSAVSHRLQKRYENERDRRGAVIEVRSEDHAFYAELYVRAVLDAGLIVAPIRPPVSLMPDRTISAESLVAHWNLGKQGFDVVRCSDNEVVKDGNGFPTREKAEEWIRDTLKAVQG